MASRAIDELFALVRDETTPPALHAQAVAALWEIGELSWKLYDDQLPFYRFVTDRIYQPADGDPGVIVGNIHRQFGKSFVLALVCVEFALRREYSQIRLVAPTQKDLRKITRPSMRLILNDCPRALKPHWCSEDDMWRYRNGAEQHIAGCNSDHADDSRGQRSDLNVIDEAGFIDMLEYLLKSVLLPQTLTTGGRTVVISTPPESPSHEFLPVLREAESLGSYFVHTLDQTTHIPERVKSGLVRDMGGIESTQVRRELYCELVNDATRAVVPEFTGDHVKAICVPVSPPTHEWPLTVMDVGFEDYTHVLFGYFDFRRAKVCVQDEIRIKRMRTDQLAEAVKAKERALWPDAEADAPNQRKNKTQRWSDVNLILLHDLSELHKLVFTATGKDNLEAMVNKVRMAVQSEQIEIDPRCVHLIRQLKGAIWNKQRTEFASTASDGHFDAVAALVYLVRNVPRYANPYPALAPGISRVTHQMMPDARVTAEAKAMKALFGVKKRKEA